MAYTDDLEQRFIKKGKGPLDIYPQEEKQREVCHFKNPGNLLNIHFSKIISRTNLALNL